MLRTWTNGPSLAGEVVSSPPNWRTATALPHAPYSESQIRQMILPIVSHSRFENPNPTKNDWDWDGGIPITPSKEKYLDPHACTNNGDN
jgi:hypothetical protein